MKNNCKHKWVKTSAIILTKDVIPILGVILDSSELQEETDKEENQSK